MLETSGTSKYRCRIIALRSANLCVLSLHLIICCPPRVPLIQSTARLCRGLSHTGTHQCTDTLPLDCLASCSCSARGTDHSRRTPGWNSRSSRWRRARCPALAVILLVLGSHTRLGGSGARNRSQCTTSTKVYIY